MDREKADIILDRIKSGMSLRKATEGNEPCKYTTFLQWVDKNPELQDQYARAMETRADVIFNDLESIANAIPERGAADGKIDNGWVQHQRLKIDTLKWMLGKMKPKKYGDKIDLTSDGEKININVNVN